MAPTTSTTKVNFHSRSISLPSTSHPFTTSVEEHLCRLRGTECNKLSALKDLYECVDNLLQTPATQQDHFSCGEEILGGSIRLLDLCSTSRDAISQMRSSVQDLESSLRRRENDVSSKAGSYLICTRKSYKTISKCFSNSKKLKVNKNTETPAIVSLLREVEEVSVNVFESIFSSICPAKETSKQNRWAVVFKSTQSKRVQCEGDNQIQKMDMALNALYKKSSKENDILGTQEVQKGLMALDMNMQECQEELDCLIRSLIKTRVSILNVLNH